ncbi:MAG: aminopeptidase [Nitrosospira sp.]
MLRIIIAVGLTGWFAGCANLGYYAQAVDGHMDIRHRTRFISEVIADPSTRSALKRALAVAINAREFAIRELKLPDNQSFTTYADLGRPYAVWNVSATPELSMELEKWCFVAIGCVSYRGFFSEAEAERFAEEFRIKGYDVTVGGVRAYSTLGWFSEPVLNTFLGYSEIELARLIFHELAHQVLYVRNDSTFNESFATAVELEGASSWLEGNGTTEQRAAFDAKQKRSAIANEIMLEYRKQLETLFASDESNAGKRKSKTRIFAELRGKLLALEPIRAGSSLQEHDKRLARYLNNAYLASISTYTNLVPGFQALLAQQNGDIGRFYQAVKEISQLPETERTSLLQITGGNSRNTATTAP